MRFGGVFQRENKSENGHPSKPIFPLRLSSFYCILNYYFTTVAPIPERTKDLICLKPSLRGDLHDSGLRFFFLVPEQRFELQGVFEIGHFHNNNNSSSKAAAPSRHPRFHCFGTRGCLREAIFTTSTTGVRRNNFIHGEADQEIQFWSSGEREEGRQTCAKTCAFQEEASPATTCFEKVFQWQTKTCGIQRLGKGEEGWKGFAQQ